MADETCIRPSDRCLRTQRLMLRRVRSEDAAAIAAYANDRQIAEMTARIPFPYTIAHAEAFLHECGEDELVLAVRERAGQGFVGLCSLKERSGNAVELGYWLGRPFWGRGLATEAAQAVIDLAFEQLQVDAVEVSCRVVNNASRRVIQKCGFGFCGTGMWISQAAGRVASENYRMDRKCWRSLKSWGGR